MKKQVKNLKTEIRNVVKSMRVNSDKALSIEFE